MTALALGLVAALCWGLHDIAIRYLSRTVPLLGALFVVLVTGLAFQSLVLFFSSLTDYPTGRPLVYAMASGGAFLIASLGLYFAFGRGPVRLVSPIIGAYPVLSLTFAALGGAPVTADQVGAVLLVVLAVGFVAVVSDNRHAELPAKGPTVLLSLVSATGFACTFHLGHLAAETGGEWQTIFIARSAAVIGLFVIIVLVRPNLRMGGAALLPLVTMGILDGVALLAVISAAGFERPEYAAVASSMFGLFTIVLAHLFLRERMATPQWLGCAVAFLGIGYLAL